ncbi:hypothetical protein [Streptomyces griseosporeus]|uniref:hypothetical protein n=1 Tax=Streptomyces griseosporeus TaxID=1910 RepID=UPI0036F5E4E8
MASSRARARRGELLEAIRAEPGDWTTGRAVRWQKAAGWGCNRSTARADLSQLATEGWLIASGPDNDRVYRLNYARAQWLGHHWHTPAARRSKRRPQCR